MIGRRAVLGGPLAAMAASSTRALAQSPKLPRVGILALGAATADMIGPEPSVPYTRAFILGMRELGWSYGIHYITEPRGGEGKVERYAGLVAELIGLSPDVIVVGGAAYLVLLKQSRTKIPVVMTASYDPVLEGFVESLARPGGNFTGMSLQSVDIVGKRLELLKEVVPGDAQIGVVWDRFSAAYWPAVQAAAASKGWRVVSLEIESERDVDRIFAKAAEASVGSLIVFASGHLFGRQREFAAKANASRLPAMFELRPYVEAGGLMSYSASLIEIWRRAATFVDKILKGANPADLPIEQPTKFELVINLKTAKALGLSMPPSILIQADEVIE